MSNNDNGNDQQGQNILDRGKQLLHQMINQREIELETEFENRTAFHDLVHNNAHDHDLQNKFHQLGEITDQFVTIPSTLDVEKYSWLNWRSRPPFSLPTTWQEIGLFIGMAVAIQFAYNIFSPQVDNDDENGDDFPIENINPIKRQDYIILQQTSKFNELYLQQQLEQQNDIQRVQMLKTQGIISEADIEAIMGEYNGNDHGD